MQVTRDCKRRRTESEWQEIISRFRASGLSLRAFARKKSLPEASLQRWNRRLAATVSPSQPDFVDVTPALSAASTWQAEIEFPNGLVFRLRG